MANYQYCVKLLDHVLVAAVDSESAYLLRTRLKRAISACFTALSVDDAAPATAFEKLRLIEDLSRHLLQPSEALDVRWRTRWSRLSGEIEGVRNALQETARASNQG